jgi:hypothetical protein
VITIPRPQLQQYDTSLATGYQGQYHIAETVVSTTTLAIQRLEAGHYDTYEPGTARERRYLNTQFNNAGGNNGDSDISSLGVQSIEVELGDPQSDTDDVEGLYQ